MIDIEFSAASPRTVHRLNKARLAIFCIFAFVFTATLAFLSTSHQEKTEATGFNAGNIISDAVMADYNSMSVSDIQSFLNSKNACNQSAEPSAVGALWYEDVNVTKNGINYNRRYYFNSPQGVTGGYYHVKDGHFVCLAQETINGKSAAYHIWDAAVSYNVNPKVLIVLLEKEQSLITDKWPYEVQYRAATGYGCPDTAECDTKYYGLEAQLANAAYLFHSVLNGGWTNYPVGKNYIQYHKNTACGGSVVNIENLATSSLYRYTPYQPNAAVLAGRSDGCSAYGNYNFYTLYTNWFGSTQNVSGKTREPDETYIGITEQSMPGVLYQSHLEDYGWEGGWLPVANGTVSGTVGESKRLEAMHIKLVNLPEGAHVYYMSHVQDLGWEKEWKGDADTTGTTGKSKRLEAIKIKLDNNTAKSYDIYYRAHVQDYGWLAWSKNGEAAGSEGLAKRLEAIQIFVVKKGDTPPENVKQSNNKSFIKK